MTPDDSGSRSVASPILWPRALILFFLLTLGLGADLRAIAQDSQSLPRVESQELPRRAPSAGPTRFSTLPSEVTGLSTVNEYADPRMWSELYPAFAFGSLGTGIAIADYDHDGRPDVFLVNKTGSSRLYRNLGDWRFADVTVEAGVFLPPGPWGQGAAFADVNNDGWLDLYVCRHAAANLLFMNQGDGTFVERAAAAGLDLVDASVAGSFHDYDRDGWLDVYVQTNLLDNEQAPKGQRDHLYRNRGDGTFEEVTQQARLFGHTQGHSATWWDYNDDGWPDLYVANDFAAPDQLYHNRDGKVFADVADLMLPRFPHFAMGADLGDVNNDGRLDLFVADMLPRNRDQNVQGMLNMQVTMAREVPAGAAEQVMRNALYVSTGSGRQMEAAFLAGIAATDWTWSPRFEDLDEDGRVDLHICNGMVRDFLDNDLIGRMSNMSFDQRRRLVLAAPELRERNLVFRNLGQLRFEESGAAWGLDHFGISFGCATGDLDGDGDLDLVFANYQGAPTVCRNDSTENHRVLVSLRSPVFNRFGVGAQVRIETGAGVQVRQLNVTRGYASSSEPVLHFGLGEDAHIHRLTVTWPSGRKQVLRDLPADRHYTIHEPAGATQAADEPQQRLQFLEMGRALGLPATAAEASADEFADQPLLPVRKQPLGPSAAVGDLDQDGVDDLVLGGAMGSPLRVFTSFAGRYLPGGNPVLARSAALADAAPLILDANQDGVADLLIPKGGVSAPDGDAAYQPRLLLGNGSGYFREAEPDALPPMVFSAGPAVAVDWNQDGSIDVFVGGRVVPGAYPVAPRSTLLKNRGGQFIDVTEEVAPGLARVGLVNSALWTDVDQDGRLDLLLALEWGGVRCWRNIGGTRFVEASDALGFAAAGHGWWQSIAAADFNGDGQVDYAVGNVGLNTRYRATVDEPLVLFRTVLADGAKPQLLEAETIGGRLIPVRGRNSLGPVVPGFIKRLPTYAAYAEASIEDVAGSAAIAAARRWSVTELRTGVFLSENGRFRFQPLPHEAQISPTFGLAAGDFDGDAHADLYAVHNTHAPNIEVGRFTGGVSCFMRGDGKGGFAVAPVAETGLLVPEEARALVVNDVNSDGWADFVVTCRGAQTFAFVNGGRESRNSFAVRLVGATPAHVVAGAKVTVVHPSGARQTAELYAGGGYLSQSSELFFGYLAQDLPAEIQVRWPNGKTSSHPWTSSVRVILKQP